MLEDLLAPRCVGHLRMELDAVHRPLAVLEGGHGHGVGAGRHAKAGRGGDDGVGVAHPDFLLEREVAEQGRAGRDLERRAPVLAGPGTGHLPAQLLGDELGAVADPEDRDAGAVDGLVDAGGALHVHRLGPAAEDDPLGLASQHLGDRHVAGHDLGVDVRLADPPGDELCVLGAEVDDEDGVERLRRGAQWPIPTPWLRCRDLPSVFRAGATMTSAFWNSLTDS